MYVTINIFRKYITNRKNKDILVRFISTPPAPVLEGGSGPFSGRNMPREGRLAIARNLALDELSTMPVTDYVIMIDMDIVGWDINGVLDSFSQRIPPASHDSARTNSSKESDSVSDRDSDSGSGSDNESTSVSHGKFRGTSGSSGSSDNSKGYDNSGDHRDQGKQRQKHKWDVICSNGIILHGVYRDIYAFRAGGLNTNHHWAGQDGADYGLLDKDLANRRQNLNVSTIYLLEPCFLHLIDESGFHSFILFNI